jgi:uncharacterized membrane protein
MNERTTVEPRSVEAVQGWRWIAAGFSLFFKSPLIWMAFFLVYFFAAFVFAFLVPLIGPVIWALLDPIFIAGFMIACRTLEVGEEMEIAHLFAAFRLRPAPLATLGAYYLAGKVLAISIAAFIATQIMGGELPELDFAEVLRTQDPEMMRAMGQHLLMVLAFFMAFLLPLLMAYWFAPALVVFDNMTPVEAMKLSFRACLRNAVPFLIYGVAAVALLILGALPMMLGMVAVLPVLAATSIYTGYRDIFIAEQPAGISETA